MSRVVLASGNAGKLREFAAMLADAGIELVPQSDFAVSAPPETAVTFVENALTKARHAAGETGLAAIADDSGLEVDALGGAPGVHSARFAGAHGDDRENNARLLGELDGVPAERRTARYRAVLVYLRAPDDPAPIVAEGTWEGRIAAAPRGDGGFGYDPLFELADGRTAAELPAEEKNLLSHRGKALAELRRRLDAQRDRSGDS
ncbi:MAG: RdgB/HAM1 family non-canonical purine NTP pyrophosphatase [Halofilum sp. (in: g-proteobacteria)]|nr:RdgB/HAM1 family non-canonical purine NTP pyrophosphatase [Halofilum sp. (in: g-proteobacteria)]